jgi:HAD superfamily hydrolase (TIGR01450 family)
MTDLLDRYDVVLADLDGTLYRSQDAVPGAVEAVLGAAARGVRTVYVTNNAARRPADVARHLADLGFPADPDDVATSSQAAAVMLAEQLPAGSPVLVVGTDALADEVRARGLTVTDDPADAAAVVQGHSPDTGWRLLADATVALRAGALWVACNLDATLPTERGPLPGNGSMVAALRAATGLVPQVAGKPATAQLLAAVERTGAKRALVVGDRLDTDIEGGRAAGLATMLVLSGVSDAAQVLAAPPGLRPDYIGADVASLTAPADSLAPGAPSTWTVEVIGDGRVRLSGSGDALAALRALCPPHWAAGGGPAVVAADGPDAEGALAALGLGSAVGASATVDP